MKPPRRSRTRPPWPVRIATTLSLLLATSPAKTETALTPAYRALPYPAPVAGTYTIPVIGDAADGAVLDSGGNATTLHAVYHGRVVLLSFVYSTCSDINGCPLAMAVFRNLQSELSKAPALAEEIRLVTLSFDPDRDTPEVLSRYGAAFRRPEADWQFLTTRSAAELQPILDAYRQPVTREADAAGGDTGGFSHLLRVFLIDRRQKIRNIYSAAVLHPDLVLADIRTLLREASPRIPSSGNPPAAAANTLRSGDDKTGYESTEYRTRSVALAERRGGLADLSGLARRPVRGLPPLPVPKDNPLTRDKIALGRKLFYDRRLSLNDTLSCAMCHIPEQGFTSQQQATAVGIEGGTVRRNAPTIYNVAYLDKLFHDSRESSLENQVWGPLLAANEMGNPSVGFVVDKLQRLPDYRGGFERAFGRGAGIETIGQAIASYERTLISGNSAFDRWHFGHQRGAMDAEAQRGFALFTGKAGCAKCHTIGSRSALFTDQGLHNTGLGYRESMGKAPVQRRVPVAPGIAFELDQAMIGQVAELPPGDLGLYEITRDPADRWKYKTPGLRNLALTAPYMHNGSLRTLREVVEFYNRGGEPNEGLDPLIRPLGLDGGEIDALIEFLQSLTGDNIETLVRDAYAAPLGDPR